VGVGRRQPCVCLGEVILVNFSYFIENGLILTRKWPNMGYFLQGDARLFKRPQPEHFGVLGRPK
jgi:hypothetical protein